MKKVLVASLAMMLAVGAAASASAAVLDYRNTLTRAVFDPTQKELIADLGDVDTQWPATANVYNGGFSLNDFNVGTQWSDLNLSYMSYNTVTVQTGPMPWDISTTQDIWFGSTRNDMTINDVNLSGTNAFGSQADLLFGQMSAIDGTTTLNPTNPNSWTNQMGDDGRLGILIPDFSAQVNLASFDAAGDQYVDMFLYHIQKVDTAAWTMLDADKLTLRTFEDGSTTTSAVPVPGAVWLLGSGLAGILGLRRKNS